MNFSLQKALPIIRNGHRLRVRSQYYVSQIRLNTTQYSRSFVPVMTRLWNDLPNGTVELEELQKFKLAVNVFMLNRLTYFGVCCSIRKYNNQKMMPFPSTPQSASSSPMLTQYPDIASIGNSMYSSVTDSGMTEKEVKKAVGDISDKFAEAMELMNDARSSLGTVYFSEDVTDTQAQVKETLDDYNNLLSRLSEKQRKTVIQSIGLKMEELKAQLSLLEDLAKE